MNKSIFLKELQKLILKKIGITHTSPGDCKNISHTIYSETNKYVSETTLKRFFGYAAVKHNFSAFTLNTLCEFVGSKSWAEFTTESENTVVNDPDSWENEKAKLSIITDISIRHIQNNSLLPFNFIAKRKLISIDYQFFLESNTQIYFIVAPRGYGKSVSLAQMASEIANSGKNKQDILLFLNYNILKDSRVIGLKIEDWIKEKMGFGDSKIHLRYFNHHPEFIKGKLIVIIDGFDNPLKVKNNINLLNDLFLELKEISWIRIVISLRNSTWLTIKHYLNNYEFLKKVIYWDNFKDTNLYYNQPLLSENEILQTINNIDAKNYTLEDIHPYLFKQLQSPPWFSQFFKFRKENPELALSSDIFTYELIHDFVVNNISNENDSTEMMIFLEKIASKIVQNKKNSTVNKEKIAAFLYPNIDVFKKLIELGVIIEEKTMINGLHINVIRFAQDFYDYFLYRNINTLAQEHLNESAYKYIVDNYQNNENLTTSLLKWCIRDNILNNQYDCLKSILTLPLSTYEKQELCSFTFQIILNETSKSTSTFNKSDVGIGLLSFFVKSDIAHPFYFNVVDKLLEHQLNSETSLNLALIKAEQCINRQHLKSLERILLTLKDHQEYFEKRFPINPYYIIESYFSALSQPEKPIEIADYIATQMEQIAKQTKMVGALTFHEIISFRLALKVLMYREYFSAYKHTYEILRTTYPNIWENGQSIFTVCTSISIGRIALKEHNFALGLKKLEELKNTYSDDKTAFFNYFARITLLMFEAEVLIQQNELDAALLLTDQALAISLQSESKMHTKLLYQTKISVLRAIQNADLLIETLSAFELYKAKEGIHAQLN